MKGNNLILKASVKILGELKIQLKEINNWIKIIKDKSLDNTLQLEYFIDKIIKI